MDLELTPRTFGKVNVNTMDWCVTFLLCRMYSNFLFFFLVDFGLGGLALTLRTLGKGNCEGYGVVCRFLERARTYSNVLFLFFVDFGLGDLELTPRR